MVITPESRKSSRKEKGGSGEWLSMRQKFMLTLKMSSQKSCGAKVVCEKEILLYFQFSSFFLPISGKSTAKEEGGENQTWKLKSFCLERIQ